MSKGNYNIAPHHRYRFVIPSSVSIIKPAIESLKEFSLLIPEIVNNNDKIVRDITKIITDIKYL